MISIDLWRGVKKLLLEVIRTHKGKLIFLHSNIIYSSLYTSPIILSHYEFLYFSPIKSDDGFPFLCHIFTLCMITEKWGNVEIIVGIPLLIKAIILGIQNILEVLLEDLGIHKRESAILHNSINIIIIVLYVNIH